MMLVTGLMAMAAGCRALRAISGIVSLMRRPRERAPHREVRGETPVTEKMHGARRLLHPHQITELSKLEPGRAYAFVHTRECDGRTFVYPRVFAGAFDRPPTARELASTGREGQAGCGKFTIHHDGWSPNGRLGTEGETLILLWRDGQLNSYCGPDYSLGRDSNPGQHELLVPLDRWDESPRIRTDWDDEVVHRPEENDINRKVWVRQSVGGERVGGVMTRLAEGATRGADEPIYYVTFALSNGHYGCTLFGLSQMEPRQGRAPVDSEA